MRGALSAGGFFFTISTLIFFYFWMPTGLCRGYVTLAEYGTIYLYGESIYYMYILFFLV